MNKDWDKVQERGSIFLIKVLIFLVKKLGRRNCQRVLFFVIPYYFIVAGNQRRNSLSYFKYLTTKNIRLRLPVIESYFHFYEFGCQLIDKIAIICGQLNFNDIQRNNTQILRTAIEKKIGVVVLSAHLGNLEVVSVLAEEFPELIINALMHTANSANFRAFQKKEGGLRVIPLDDFAPAIFLELQEIIQAGGVVSMMADRVTPGAKEKTVKVKILEKELVFPQGPWIIAELLETPIFLVFSLRNKNGSYDLFVEELHTISRKTEIDRNLRIQRNAQEFAKILEHYILKAPNQFFNFHQNWTP